MALDDFATAAEMGLDPAEVDLDEDLFDFPMLSPQDSRSEGDEAEGNASRAESDSPPSQEAPVAAEAPPPSPPPAPTQVSPPRWELDPVLDEDLFGFPSDDLTGTEPLVQSESAIEQHIDQATQEVSDFLEDDPDELIGTEEPSLPSSAPPPIPTSAPAQAQAPAPAPAPVSPVRPVAIPTTPPMSGTLTPMVMPERSSRIAWTLTATVILFVVGLLAVSWRATASLDQSMVGMQESLEDGNRRMAAQNELTMRRLSEMESELLRQQKLAAQAAAGVPVAEKPREMMAPHELNLLVAREAIDEGRYGEARRVLYHLLATADRLGKMEREMAEQTAAFLIGQTYQAEAEALEGGAR